MPKQITRPADPDTGPIAQFGYDLRMLRQNAGFTYQKLAALSYFSAAALHRADQGHVLPTEGVTRAFVEACGKDPQPFLDRRKDIARTVAAGRAPSTPKATPRTSGVPAPDPGNVSTTAEFIDALKRLREWSGLTFRQLQRIAEAASYPRQLPASTLCARLKGGTLPPYDLVDSLVRAVGLDEAQQRPWLQLQRMLEDGRPVRRDEPSWKRWATGGNGKVHTLVDPDRAIGATAAVAPDGVADGSWQADVRDWIFRDGEWLSTDEAKDRERHRFIAAAVSRAVRWLGIRGVA